jgi:hypothetical protein
VDPSFAEDAAGVRQAMEYYADQGWTDGLPVVPVTESYLGGVPRFSPAGTPVTCCWRCRT